MNLVSVQMMSLMVAINLVKVVCPWKKRKKKTKLSNKMMRKIVAKQKKLRK